MPAYREARQLFATEQPILTAVLIRLVQALDYARADLTREVMLRAIRETGGIQEELAGIDPEVRGFLDRVKEAADEATDGNPFEEQDEWLEDKIDQPPDGP